VLGSHTKFMAKQVAILLHVASTFGDLVESGFGREDSLLDIEDYLESSFILHKSLNNLIRAQNSLAALRSVLEEQDTIYSRKRLNFEAVNPRHLYP
jgi:hypothetical protein